MATGLPPIEYLIRLRIRQSMELLTASDMSVTDIAMECGFNDSNYFARQFKRINDMSASEFRKRHLTSIPH
jgi:AraC-like DNA-binding protein